MRGRGQIVLDGDPFVQWLLSLVQMSPGLVLQPSLLSPQPR